jgi:hypothetical protein
VSELRKHLQATKAEYAAVRYPGDLVADVRKAQRNMPLRWAIGLTSLAAMIAVSVVLYSRIETITNETPTVAKTEEPAVPGVKHEVASALPTTNASEVAFQFAAPSAPTGINSMVPSFGMPSGGLSLPSWDGSVLMSSQNSETNSTETKESL